MEKDIIVILDAMRPATIDALEIYQNQSGRSFTPLVLVDEKIASTIYEINGQDELPENTIRIIADFDSPFSIRNALNPYMDRIFAVTAQYENAMLELKKLMPYLPHLSIPTEKSLDWATEKKLMRELLESYDASLVPRYLEVRDAEEESINAIEKTLLSYPMIIKPSGLESSMLVTRVDSREELRTTLAFTFNEMRKAYSKWIKRQDPIILVEEFMEGDMYSVDTYISPSGECRHTPPVKVLTGRNVGFDDFFGYLRLTPSGLSDDEIIMAYETAEKACHALALRSVTAHVELMRTAYGWKIVELGARIGGYRHELYNMAYDINHIVNDIRNRAGEVPEIPQKTVSHTAVIKFYPRQEGVLRSIEGLEEIKQLSSFVSVSQYAKIGTMVRFAKNNGGSVLLFTLSHKNRDQLMQDIKTLEDTLIINTTSA